MIKTVGSVCSGIEAASVAWEPLGLDFVWFSEIAAFPSKVLAERYPSIPNLGDMNRISKLLLQFEAEAPDLICGGTPCQAFSVAGWQNGLNDDRGNLSLKFVDIIESNDSVRRSSGLDRSIVFWENVEGVLSDRTNAFGCLISSLAGLPDALKMPGGRWPCAGLLRGPKRNLAWRVLDAKYFGLPQQRRRLYLVAGGNCYHPENALFESHSAPLQDYPDNALTFEIGGHHFEVFRKYTDCLYSAYGTKWNGNAAAYNGSLFVVQDGRIRRLSPLEAERLMGLPDNYTLLKGANKTSRYQAVGNSWAVPVVRWLGARLQKGYDGSSIIPEDTKTGSFWATRPNDDCEFFDFGREQLIPFGNGTSLNCTAEPENCTFANMGDILSADAQEDIYISPVGCQGILRRRAERNLNINPRLEQVLQAISSQMPSEDIERISRVQRRGKFSA